MLTFACASWSSASESFSHPIFTSDRHVLLDTPQVPDASSPYWKTLNLIFPGSLERVRSRKVHVLIDDFSQFSWKSPEFASYFVHDDAGPIIGLDCSSTVARFYWLYSLVHELIHAVLDGEGADS